MKRALSPLFAILLISLTGCGQPTPMPSDEERAQIVAHRQAMQELFAAVTADDFEHSPEPQEEAEPVRTRERIGNRIRENQCRVTRTGARLEVGGEAEGCGVHLVVRQTRRETGPNSQDARHIPDLQTSLRLQMAIADSAWSQAVAYSRVGMNMELDSRPGDSLESGKTDGYVSIAVETPAGPVRWSRDIHLRGGENRNHGYVRGGSIVHRYEFPTFQLEARVDYLNEVAKYRLNGHEVSQAEFVALVSDRPDAL